MSERIALIGAACVLSMLFAVTVDILYGTHRNPPVWVERWFFWSVMASIWLFVVPWVFSTAVAMLRGGR